VGTVERIEGADEIKLAKDDPDAGGQERYIPLAWLGSHEVKGHLQSPARSRRDEGAPQSARCRSESTLEYSLTAGVVRWNTPTICETRRRSTGCSRRRAEIPRQGRTCSSRRKSVRRLPTISTIAGQVGEVACRAFAASSNGGKHQGTKHSLI